MEANFLLTALTQVLTLLRRYTEERKGRGSKNLQLLLLLLPFPLSTSSSMSAATYTSRVFSLREFGFLILGIRFLETEYMTPLLLPTTLTMLTFVLQAVIMNNRIRVNTMDVYSFLLLTLVLTASETTKK